MPIITIETIIVKIGSIIFHSGLKIRIIEMAMMKNVLLKSRA